MKLIKLNLIALGPKNYAEWRSSWRQPRSNHRLDSVANAEGGENIQHNDIYTEVKLYDISGNHCSTILSSLLSLCLIFLLIIIQMVREVSLTSMKGHRHEIEYLVTDCNLVISMCLGGTINIWDYYSGENISEMNRAR